MKSVRRNMLLLAVALPALAAGYMASRWLMREPKEATATLVDFALPDLIGKERWLSEWQGRLIVLNFWATWCEPCRKEVPALIEIQKRFQDQGLQVIGVALDSRSATAQFAKDYRINYPLLLDEEAQLSIVSSYGNPHGQIPYTVIINRDGTIVARKLGPFKNVREIESIIEPLVSGKSRSILSN